MPKVFNLLSPRTPWRLFYIASDHPAVFCGISFLPDTKHCLWKETASDTTCRESWDDPRELHLAQTARQQDRPHRFIAPKKRARGPSR